LLLVRRQVWSLTWLDDVEGIARALASLYAAHENHRLRSMGPSDDMAKMFEASAVAEKFVRATLPIINGWRYPRP
jgi:hypothetical protein